MKQLFTIGIIVFFFSIQLNAQSDFREGYIVKNDNDTIYGLINYGGNKSNAKECVFKKDINSEKLIFNPDEITSFRFLSSKYYVSKLINIGSETERLFLEYLIKGIVDVYYYRDNIGEHYLLGDGDGNLYELKNEKKEIIIDNKTYIIESKKYIGILKATFKDSPKISSRADNIALNHKSLIGIAGDYHKEVCNDEEFIIYEKRIPEIKSIYGIVVGLERLSILQTGEFASNVSYLKNCRFGSETYPSIGLYYKVNMPFINEKLYFQYELTYSQVNIETSYSYIEQLYIDTITMPPSNPIEPIFNMDYLNDISFTQNLFNNIVTIRYEFPRGKIRPTFQIGGFARYIHTTNYKRNLEVQFSQSGKPYYTTQTNKSPFLKLELGINCGVGLKCFYLNNKELFLDLKYQRGSGLLQNLNTNTFLLNLGFQIGK